MNKFDIHVCRVMSKYIVILLHIEVCLLRLLDLQVETVAQFGVVFLLFALGLEFSTTKVGLIRGV